MTRQIVILLDPGHGGADPGAPTVNPVEAAINLEVATLLRDVLQNEGYVVQLTRQANITVSLDHRCQQEHALRPDLFVSLHCNAADNPTAKGIEIWTAPGDSPADPAATEIFQAVSRAFPERKLRTDYSDQDLDKEARFRVLTGTIGPAVLLEMGFVSNPEEREWLLRSATQMQMALAISSGILAWRKQSHHDRVDQIKAQHDKKAEQ